jgi:hypothetical protein
MIAQHEMSESEIIEQLKDKGTASLDLSLPVAIVRHRNSSANQTQTLNEHNVLEANERLSSMAIASVDPAGAEEYYYRPTPANILKIATTDGSGVKITDNSGRVLMVAKPDVFRSLAPKGRSFTTRAPSFHPFRQLPPEIRHKIWAISAEPRVLVANEVRTLKLLPYSQNSPFSNSKPVPTSGSYSTLTKTTLTPWFE